MLGPEPVDPAQRTDTPATSTVAPDSTDRTRSEAEPPAPATREPIDTDTAPGPDDTSTDTAPDINPEPDHTAGETATPESDRAEADLSDPTPADSGNPEPRSPNEDYLFDPDHRATAADHAAIVAAFGEGDRHNQVIEESLAKRDSHESLAHLSDEAAVSIYAYTGHDLFVSANNAHRMGPGSLGVDFDKAQHQVRSIVSALNELAPMRGELVRGIDVGGNPTLAKLVADQYVPGRTTAEPTIVSATIKDSADTVSKFGDDVEIHIQAKTARDVSLLSQNRDEREAVSKPGTQWYTHEKETIEVSDGKTTRQKTIIRVEEVLPGDPRYLDKADAEREMADRRAANRDNAKIFKAHADEISISTKLDGGTPDQPKAPAAHQGFGDALGTGSDQGTQSAPEPSVIADRLNPPEQEGGYAGTGSQHDGVALGADQAGDHDWSPLAHATNPPSEAAIHADTANPNQAAKYVAERHGDMAEVNPRYRDADAFERGYQTNCTRGVVANALRHAGIDAQAGPLRPKDMESMGTLDYVRDQLGGEWQSHGGYDDVIRTMREQPVGSRAVIAVKYTGSDGNEYGHVAEVVNTKEGVAFIDPQSNSLMTLPHPPGKLDLLPYDPATVAERHAARAHADAMGDGSPSESQVRASNTEQASQAGYGAAEQVGDPADQRGDRPLPTREQIADYLREPRVQAALQAGDAISLRDPDSRIKVDGRQLHVGEAIVELLPRHPELARILRDVPYLENSLLARPQTLSNLLRHPEAIVVLEDCVREVRDHEPGPQALAEHFDEQPKPPPGLLTTEQAEISGRAAQIAADSDDAHRAQLGFDRRKMTDAAYQWAYLDGLYENWAGKQAQLHALAESVAKASGGAAFSRPTEKSRVRAADKIKDNGGHADRLTDLVGSKIQYRSMADAYRGLKALMEHVAKDGSKVRIVEFSDRFATPQKSGYRDLQLSIRLELPDRTFHVAELRLHLTAIDDVADYEHALFEVRRDFKHVADEQGRKMSWEERALIGSILEEEKRRFGTAFELGEGKVRGGG